MLVYQHLPLPTPWPPIATHGILPCQLISQEAPEGIIELHSRGLLVHIDAGAVGPRHAGAADVDKPARAWCEGIRQAQEARHALQVGLGTWAAAHTAGGLRNVTSSTY